MTEAIPAAPAPSGRAPRAGLLRLLRAELRWIFHRPRNLIVLGLLAVLPVIAGSAIALTNGTSGSGGARGPDGALGSSSVVNALTLPIGMLTMLLAFLLPLVAAMSAADALAGESNHATLRGWLLAPVGRGRLLAVKALGVAGTILVAVLLVAVAAVLTALVISGTDSLITLSGTTLSLPQTLGRVAIAVAWVAVQLFAVGAVALAISSATEHPMLVVVSVLAGNIVFTVLGTLDALSWLHPFLLTESWRLGLVGIMRDPMMLESMWDGTLRALCYLVIGLSLAYARITTKDG